MRKEYDIKNLNSRKNQFADKLKKQETTKVNAKESSCVSNKK